jgi:hypothetical protein
MKEEMVKVSGAVVQLLAASDAFAVEQLPATS